MFEENENVEKTKKQFDFGNIGSAESIRKMLGQVPIEGNTQE